MIKIVPSTNEITVLEGDSLGDSWFKWLRGVVVPEDDNAIYGIPAAAGCVLRIDTRHGSVSTHGEFPGAPWSWHGAALGSDGKIYAIPSCAEQVWLGPTRSNDRSILGQRASFMYLPGRLDGRAGLALTEASRLHYLLDTALLFAVRKWVF